MFSIPDNAICVYANCTVHNNWFLHVVVDGPISSMPTAPRGARPTTGPVNSFGERNCIHSKVDFSSAIAKLSKTRTPYPDYPDYLETLWDRGPNTTPEWGHFDYFIAMGEDFSKEWATRYDYQIHHGSWEGNTLYVASYNGASQRSTQYYGAIRFMLGSRGWYGEYAKPKRVNYGDPLWIPGGPQTARAISWVPDYWETSNSSRRWAMRLVSGTQDQLMGSDAFQRACLNAQTWSSLAVKTADLDDWRGALSQAAAEQATALDTNMFTLIPELLHLKSGVSSLLNQLKTTLGKRSIRSLADLELSLKYGVQLTLSDLCEQARRITQRQTELRGYCRARSQLSHSGTANVAGENIPYNIRYNLKVWYDPTPDDAVHRTIWTLLSYKAIPSLEDVWDIIPYSFVVDWLTNLSDTLSQVDANTLISALQVGSALFSRKACFALPARLIPDLRDSVHGVVQFSNYTRIDYGGLVPPKPSFVGFQGFDNFVEAGAILIQKMRR